MDARNTILEARRYLLDLSIIGKDIQMVFNDIRAIIKKLIIIHHYPAYLRPIVKTYSLKEAEEDGLLGVYFRMGDKKGNDYVRYYENDNNTDYITAQIPNSQIVEENGSISIVNPMASQSDEVRNEYCKLVDELICHLYYITMELKELYGINKDKNNSITKLPEITADSKKVKPFSEYLSEHGRKHEDEITRLLTPILNGAKGTLCTTCLNLLIWYGYMDNYSDDKGRPQLRELASTLNNEFNTQLSRTSLRGIIRDGDVIVTKHKKSTSQDIIDKINKADYKSRDISELIVYLMRNALPEWKQVLKPI